MREAFGTDFTFSRMEFIDLLEIYLVADIITNIHVGSETQVRDSKKYFNFSQNVRM